MDRSVLAGKARRQYRSPALCCVTPVFYVACRALENLRHKQARNAALRRAEGG
jgi:hypothetical protein